jgi:hypothetical protein
VQPRGIFHVDKPCCLWHGFLAVFS